MNIEQVQKEVKLEELDFITEKQQEEKTEELDERNQQEIIETIEKIDRKYYPINEKMAKMENSFYQYKEGEATASQSNMVIFKYLRHGKPTKKKKQSQSNMVIFKSVILLSLYISALLAAKLSTLFFFLLLYIIFQKFQVKLSIFLIFQPFVDPL